MEIDRLDRVPSRTAVQLARHTHPGIETSYMLKGDLELAIEGKPPQKLGAATALRRKASRDREARGRLRA
jgi:hypothetical protein